MAVSTQPYKGARDFYPEDKRLQKFMFGKIRQAVEQFGYEEYDAPILEPTELFLMKGNQEIIDEQTYTFLDRGERSVTIRTEMTPTVSRMVAGKRQELAYPLRWYSIPNLWRYERPQAGRLREFWQLNVDIFGVEGLEADHEIVMVVDRIMKAFKATPSMYTIKLNSRVLMNHLMKGYLGLDEVQTTSIGHLIDRMHKMDRADFIAQVDAICSPAQRENGVVDKMMELLDAKSLSDLPAELQHHEATQRLQAMLAMLENSGVSNAKFDITLMRGFDYYTDIVFEVFDNHPENNRAMCGGGRYDGLVGQFGVETVPTVGFGFGDVTLQRFLELHELIPHLPPDVDAHVLLIGNIYAKAQHFLKNLRDMGLNVAVDISGRKLDKQMKTADKKGVHYVIIVGEQELESEQYKLKNLQTGVEETHGAERIVSIVKDYRQDQNESD